MTHATSPLSTDNLGAISPGRTYVAGITLAWDGTPAILAARPDGVPELVGTAAADVLAPLRALGFVPQPSSGSWTVDPVRSGPVPPPHLEELRRALDLDLLACLRDVGSATSAECGLLADGPMAGRRRDFARARPFFLNWIAQGSVLAAVDSGRPVDGAISSAIGAAASSRGIQQASPAATVARLSPLGLCGASPRDVADLAWRLRPEDIPAPGDEARAFAMVAEALAVSGLTYGDVDWRACLLPCGRNWRARLDALLRASDRHAGSTAGCSPDADRGHLRTLANAFLDIRDWRRAYDAEILAPAIAGSMGLRPDVRYCPPREVADPTLGLSLRKALDMASRWARERNGRADDNGSARWPAPFEAVRLAGDIVAVPLASRADLVDEGRDGEDANGVAGLSHCSATYASACASGRSVIVSLRATGCAPVERLATAELAQGEGGRLSRLVQLRGQGNAPPGPAAMEAAAELVRLLSDGSVPLSPDWMELRPATTAGPLDAVSGFPHDDVGALARSAVRWHRWLPKGVGSLPPGEAMGSPRLARAVRAASGGLAPPVAPARLDDLAFS